MNSRTFVAATLAGAAVLTALFLVDLLAVDRTLLTPYAETHPASQPLRHPGTGLVYVKDLRTGDAFTAVARNQVAYVDERSGRIDPTRDARNIRLPQGRVEYLHEPLSPLYAFVMPVAASRLPRAIPAVALSALVLFALTRLRKLPDAAWIAGLPVAALLLRAAFAWIRQPLGGIGSQFFLYDNEEVLFDIPRVGNVLHFLRHYPEIMGGLSLHGSHFPPGYVLLLKGLATLAGHHDLAQIRSHAAFYGSCLLALGASALVPLYLLARNLFGKEAALFAAGLFLLAPNSIAYGAVSLDAVFSGAALWTLWAFHRALSEGSSAHAAAAGILLGVTTLLSFSGIALGLFLVLFAVWRPARRPLVRVAGGLLLTGGVLYLALGFDFIACFRTARHLEAQLMESAAAQRGTTLGALRGYLAWGNLLAFFLGSGLVLAGPWVLATARAVRDRASVGAPFTLALLGVILVGGLAVYHLETERIWLYLTAALTIPVGALLAGARGRANRLFLCLAVPLAAQALAVELLLFTLW